MGNRRGCNGKRGVTAEMRFLAKVQKTDTCWIWTGAFVNAGYGQFWYEGKRITAHRFSYAFYKGPVTNEFDVCHTCDNKKCVNPDHLFTGTAQDNLDDMKRKGRSATGDKNGVRKHPEIVRRGEKNGGAKTNDEQVLEIRRLFASGEMTNFMWLAKRFNLSATNIRNIVHRNTWKHI